MKRNRVPGRVNILNWLMPSKHSRRRRTTSEPTETLESRTLLTILPVSNAAEFVNAVNIANWNPTILGVEFDGTDLIELNDTVTYTNTQPFTIDGNGGTLQPVAGSAGDFDLFVTTGGSDLYLQSVTIQDGLNGVVVNVPPTATGLLTVGVSGSTLASNAEFGLHIDDIPVDSPATMRLRMDKGRVMDNGHDGVRIDEGGNGDVVAVVFNSVFAGNGGDGLQVVERDAGNMDLSINNSSLYKNGFGSSGDGVDVSESGTGDSMVYFGGVQADTNQAEGIDIRENSDGRLHLRMEKVQLRENGSEGIWASEGSTGDIVAELKGVDAIKNGAEGIYFRESLAGNLSAELSGIRSYLNGDDGIYLREIGDGNIDVAAQNIFVRSNEGEGMFVRELGDGHLQAQITGLNSVANEDNGIKLEENDAGNFMVELTNSSITWNGGYGIFATQEAPGSGSLGLSGVTLFGNFAPSFIDI